MRAARHAAGMPRDGRTKRGQCRLQFNIRLIEPRCPNCLHLLLNLTSDRCPECGTQVGSRRSDVPETPAA